MKTDITKIRKNIYSYMKNKAHALEGNLSDELISYQRSQNRYANRDFLISSFQNLVKSLKRAKVIYLGDFHSFDQSSRNFERIMRPIAQSNKSITLGVEFVHIEYQVHIDNYLNNLITEIEFLENIDYYESWRFPWNQYKVFFELARSNGHKIIALNSHGSLSQRDKRAAEILVEYIENNPKDKLLVLFGEYHITPSKLPKQVRDRSKSKFIQSIVHQNLDKVYWKLEDTQMGRKKTQVIEFDENEFSIQSSAPWVKYESMIYWYENLLEDPDFDIHEYMMESGLKSFTENANDTFLFLTEKMLKALNIKINKSRIEDFNLHDHQKMSFILKKAESIKSKSVSKYFKGLVVKGRSFKVPHTNDYYCSNYSINRLAYLGGVHIWHLQRGLSKHQTIEILSSSSQEERFTFLMYQFCYAYFCSKVINPFRKCDLYADIFEKSKMKQSSDTTYYQKCLELIEYDQRAIDINKTMKGMPLDKVYKMAKIIGYMLGDLLFDNHFEKRSKKYQTITNTLCFEEFSQENYIELCKALLPKRRYKTFRKRFF
ncbi:ChaN family lipoprotein [Halobacteriovorax sp.]|uniref:ChaN family lipoprotein n=1 Tax=Halobacteriovorax sp. TaxID=2020862 RepID=UPI0035643093